MGLDLVWLGTIWGAAVGILVADVVYFLTDSLQAFLLTIPFAFIGYLLGKRALRRRGTLDEFSRKRM